MNKPHKHAVLIKAWADGAQIQFFHEKTNEWCDTQFPDWHEDTKFRVKPEPVYPKSRISKNVFSFLKETNPHLSFIGLMMLAADAGIKQAIIDGDVIINPNKD